jgi:hypothetical protein
MDDCFRKAREKKCHKAKYSSDYFFSTVNVFKNVINIEITFKDDKTVLLRNF